MLVVPHRSHRDSAHFGTHSHPRELAVLSTPIYTKSIHLLGLGRSGGTEKAPEASVRFLVRGSAGQVGRTAEPF